MINLEIDGKTVQVENGATVMDAATKLGIFVPHFCYHKKLSIAANCRMCLVQVEKAPKPLPACATPATEGMKVQTASEYAKTAQKGVMEFLLINHPLDCPICDQGGECQLQDLAVGYGGSASRYREEKRVVVNKNLGPLISTDMTRCIHCTRCVRFGQEIAGIMELGMAGRGEHSEILTFVGRTVDSELSGNVIDLCPVGALTSKPFRYAARTWELARRKSVSPHDGLGSNIVMQVKQDKVMRVLPLENEAINECWLSDKDRFAYEGLNSAERLITPMIRQDGKWHEAGWQTALEFVANGLEAIRGKHGSHAIGALATPHQTLEELHLLQKFVRGMGSENIDTRLREGAGAQGAQGDLAGVPWLGMNIADISGLQSVLILGSTLRKDHPLLAGRFRQAAKRGQQVNIVHVADDDLLMPVANCIVAAPHTLVASLLQIARALAEIKSAALSENIAAAAAQVQVSDAARAIARSLADKEKTAVFLGNLARHHPDAASLHAIAQEIARLAGATLGVLGEAANSVGAGVAGALPQQNGLSAHGMLASPRKAYVLLGAEPELDCHDPQQAMIALQSAELVVAMSAYRTNALDYAHVLLPIAPFSETAGTFINTEGRVQSFNGVVKPPGEARPGWKVLRALGSMLELQGFELDTVEDVRNDIAPDLTAFAAAKLNNAISDVPVTVVSHDSAAIERIGEVPIYSADAIVRRATSLQKSADGKAAATIGLPGALLEKLGVSEAEEMRVTQGGASVVMKVRRDDGLPANCVRIAAGHPLTATLGAMFGNVTLERVAVARAAD
jgi:NADH-quinone oxidoreductase subunit G